MLKVTEYNYDHYKKIAEVIWNYTLKGIGDGISEDTHPVNVLNRWEQLNKSRAIRGLQIGLLDSISSLREASDDQKKELNELLIKADLPSLYNILTIGQNVPAQVLKRNKIRNIEEYYLITDLLSAVDAAVSEADRTKLNESLLAFEKKRKK